MASDLLISTGNKISYYDLISASVGKILKVCDNTSSSTYQDGISDTYDVYNTGELLGVVSKGTDYNYTLYTSANLSALSNAVYVKENIYESSSTFNDITTERYFDSRDREYHQLYPGIKFGTVESDLNSYFNSVGLKPIESIPSKKNYVTMKYILYFMNHLAIFMYNHIFIVHSSIPINGEYKKYMIYSSRTLTAFGKHNIEYSSYDSANSPTLTDTDLSSLTKNLLSALCIPNETDYATLTKTIRYVCSSSSSSSSCSSSCSSSSCSSSCSSCSSSSSSSYIVYMLIK